MKRLIFFLLLWATGYLSHGQTITAAEYFFDADPGYGSGTAVTITSGASIDANFSIATSGLSVGFHTLYVRARNNTGAWGLAESRLVYVHPSGAGNTANISKIEYYFDADPGYGSGTAVNVSTPANMVDIAHAIPTGSLSTGFHTLFIRAQDINGTWGLSESRLVYVDAAGAGTAINVNAIEYFFDTDPGYGSGTLVNASTPANVVDVMTSINTASIATGFHTLFIRARNAGGVWGPAEARLIFVDASGVGTAINVDAIEYFFDADPGYGSGTTVNASTPANMVDIMTSINTASIATGFHTLYVRARNAGGTWGPAESRLIFVDASGAGTAINVDAIEYFFDADPGYGAGTRVNATTPANMVDITASINTSSLSTGFHTLFIRARNAGGTWGMTEARLIFVDASGAGTTANISELEYFFNADPGYGLGTKLTVTTPANSVDLNAMVTSSSLPLGFHTLFFRAKDENNTWGPSESRLIYVDPSGAGVFTGIDMLEYFFDNDPGFGNGTALPFTATDSIVMDVVLPASALSEGQHTLTIRPRNINGTWGLGETFSFSSLSPSRELDSLALKVFYDKTGGANWTTNTNWFTGTLDTWFGVDVVNGRVDSVRLASNNVVGKMPKEFSFISELKKVDLSFNQLADTIPNDFTDLTKLRNFTVNNNSLLGLPDMSSIATIQTMALDTNFFDFADLEPLVSISGLTYKGQKITQVDSDSIVAIGQQLNFTFDIGGTNNTYQWFKDGQPINGANQSTYIVPNFALLDTGTYRLDVNNTVITDLTIKSQNFKTAISQFEEDSLGMVSLYNALGGANWTNNTNWLSGNLSTWFGLTVTGNRVRNIVLNQNNLAGKFPMDINLADSLVEINIAQNSVGDTIPTTFRDLRALQTLNVSNNQIQSIPALNSIPTLSTLAVDNNRLQFADLEANLGVATFTYAPQALISPAKDTLVETGTNPMLSVFNNGLNNSYQWFKDNVAFSTSEVLSFTDVDFNDEGTYRLDITNSIVTGLTLSSGDITFRVSSLQRDTDALKQLFTETQGNSWTDNTGWDQALADNSWVGVTLSGDGTRVIGLNLSNNNLVGSISDQFRDITQIETVNLSQNQITDIPFLGPLDQLTSFDVSDNRLGFEPLEDNASLAPGVLNYANQKNVDINETGDPAIKVQVNGNQMLSVTVNGANNTYQWSLNGNPIAGATASTYDVTGIDITKMGNYSVATSNTVITDLQISSNPRTVLAVTDVLGTVFQPGGTDPITAGNITIYEIQDGPYDSLTTVDLGADGSFLFDDITLGNYNILTRPDLTVNPDYLQTYLGNGIFWEEADTLFLRDVLTGLNITMQGPPADPVGDAAIFGIVEQDLPEGRTLLPRRRSGRAGCAFRRVRGIGRGEMDDLELVAYTETNDNGEFRVDNLEDGEYLFNVEFPGIPMDPNSFISFNLGENLDDSELQLAALITEDGITVEKIVEVGIPTPLFRTAVAYPNPAHDQVSIRYSLARPVEGLVMEVLGVDGVRYMSESLDHSFGLKEMHLDLTGMAAGMYLLTFQDTEGKYRQQLRITKH